MTSLSSSRARQIGGGRHIVMAIGVGVFCVTLLFALMVMNYGDQPEANRGQTAAVHKQPEKKALPAMNLALGNVVAVIPELGLSVKGIKEEKKETPRVKAKIDSQLPPLRELFRHASDKQATLMGGMLIEFTIGAQGQVTQIKELSTRLANAEFRKAVLAAASKWEFRDTLPEGAIVTCPLLFVREGMDITTLVQWEKHLGLFEDKHLLSRAQPAAAAAAPVAPANPNPDSKAGDTAPEKTSSQTQGNVTPYARKSAAPTAQNLDPTQVDQALRATARAEGGEM